MPRTRPGGTSPMQNNQAKLDELEYFIERIGLSLFGPGADDFRLLGRYVPPGSNLSLLVDAARANPGRDLAADFAFVLEELRRSASAATASTVPTPPEAALFNYLPYLDLLANPESLLSRLDQAHQAALHDLIERAPSALNTALARVSAYAWLELVGLPDLRVEFDPAADKRLALDPGGDHTRAGLEAIYATLHPGTGEPLRRYLGRAHYLLSLEYKDQVRRLVTQVS